MLKIQALPKVFSSDRACQCNEKKDAIQLSL